MKNDDLKLPHEKAPYEDAPYEVGFGKPPKSGQIKPGECRNPNGRRGNKKKKDDDRIDVAAVLDEPIKAKDKDGNVREVSPFESGLLRVAQQALDGKVDEILLFLDICDMYGLLKVKADDGGGVIFAPKGVSPQDWIRSENDPTFKPVPTDYDALVKKQFPDSYESYKRRQAEDQARAEKKAEEEAKARRLLSKKTGGRNRKTIVREIALRQYPDPEGNKTGKRPLVEVVLLRLRRMEAEGNRRAMRAVIKLEKRSAAETSIESGVIVAPGPVDPIEWIAEQMEENLTRKPPPGLREQYGYKEDDEDEEGDGGQS